MSQSDVNLSVVLSVIVLVLFILFYNRIFSVTFDESFAKATGTNAGLYNTLIALVSYTHLLRQNKVARLNRCQNDHRCDHIGHDMPQND